MFIPAAALRYIVIYTAFALLMLWLVPSTNKRLKKLTYVYEQLSQPKSAKFKSVSH